ncbi:Variant-specific surface protein, partial [Giardia duodenalis]
VLKSGCYSVGAVGSGVCWEARDGAYAGYAEGHSVDGGRHGTQGSSAQGSTEGDERVRDPQCADTTGNCEASACNVQIGDKLYCSQCSADATGYAPIDGICADVSGGQVCTKDPSSGFCTQCAKNYFLHKGGCYKFGGTPGSTICKDTVDSSGTAGVCSSCSAENGFFANLAPAATKQSCIACNETANIDGLKGVVGCTACKPPSAAGDSNTPKAATCTACDSDKIVKTDNDVTSCVTEEECTEAEGFFVKTNDNTKTCAACNVNCKTCSGAAEQCTSCKEGNTSYLKKTDNSQTGTCVDKTGCTGTNYIDEEAKTCSTCASAGTTDCKTCTKTDGVVTCTSCEDSQKFGLGKKSCVSQCPTNSQAGSDSVCVCNNGFTPNPDSSACVAASSCKTPHCQTCTGEGQEGETCTACATGYYLTPTGQCVDSCDKLGGYYADGNVCKPCNSSCASCTAAGADKCLSCPAGKALKYTSESDISGGGSCVDECRASTGGCDTCGAVIGGSKYCSRCDDASQAPLNGDCATNTARTQFCTIAKDGACTQCKSGLQRAARWPPCVPGSEWQTARMCAAECAAECVRLAAGLGGDGGQLLFLLPWLTRRRPVCGQHTEATARGAATQRHRSASLVEEKPASREAPLQCTSRRPRSAALARRCVPMRSCSRGELPM